MTVSAALHRYGKYFRQRKHGMCLKYFTLEGTSRILRKLISIIRETYDGIYHPRMADERVAIVLGGKNFSENCGVI